MFDVKKVTENCVKWIREFFEQNGPDAMRLSAFQAVRTARLPRLCAWKLLEKTG